MAAQRFEGARAKAAFPVAHYAGGGVVQAAYGEFTLTETPEVGDVYALCKLPGGALVMGGYLFATDIDTGTETLDIDLGWEANGTEAADPDGFINSGVLTGDAITDLLAAGQVYRPIAIPGQTFSAITTVVATVNAVAAAGGTGRVGCVVYYQCP